MTPKKAKIVKTTTSKALLALLGWSALLVGVSSLSSCGSPHYGMGVNLDYRNGKFHVRPEAHIGFSGRL
ncbi:MAG: hypothetical protein AAF726_15250 [Planctomycetota bacterium]